MTRPLDLPVKRVFTFFAVLLLASQLQAASTNDFDQQAARIFTKT